MKSGYKISLECLGVCVRLDKGLVPASTPDSLCNIEEGFWCACNSVYLLGLWSNIVWCLWVAQIPQKLELLVSASVLHLLLPKKWREDWGNLSQKKKRSMWCGQRRWSLLLQVQLKGSLETSLMTRVAEVFCKGTDKHTETNSVQFSYCWYLSPGALWDNFH